MKLAPGYYEVVRGKQFQKEYHLMRVWIEDGKRFVQLDHNYPQELNDDDERWLVQDYQVHRQFSNRQPIEIVSPKVTFQFSLNGGGEHKMTARNWHQVMRILEQFPRLKKSIFQGWGKKNKT